MKRILETLTCLILSTNATSQLYKSPNLTEISKFFRDIYGTKYINNSCLVVSEIYQPELKPLIKTLILKKILPDSIFSLADLDSFDSQIASSRGLKWTNTIIDSASFIGNKCLGSLFVNNRKDGTLGWTAFRQTQKKRSYRHFSWPCFSKNGQYCILYLSIHCGIDCGEGGLYIFELQNTKWRILRRLTRWVS
jgi:hypothetical protein